MKTTPRITAIALLGVGLCLFEGSAALAEIGPSTAFGGTNVVAPTITTYTTKIIAEYADGEVVEIPVKEGQDPNSIKVPPKKIKQKALKNSGTRAKKVALGAVVLIVVGTGLLVASKHAERKYRRKFLAQQEHQIGTIETINAVAVNQDSPKETSKPADQANQEETTNGPDNTVIEESSGAKPEPTADSAEATYPGEQDQTNRDNS